MKFKSYHKIGQFKDVVRNVRMKANFKGMDENMEPIYEETTKPDIFFMGTVKLHGTNAQISYDGKTMLAGKRGSLIDEEALTEHFGFNQFVQVTHKQYFLELMSELHSKYCKENQQIMLYGEYAGNGIQKNVGVSKLEKAFYIFDCKVWDKDTDKNEWLDISAWEFEVENIYNIHEFPTYRLEIDFNQPQNFQNKLIEITEAVEKECPVAKKFGVSGGVGEGVVWTGFWKDEKYIFKVKGEKHSTSKVKTLASVDPEIVKSIYEFVEYAVTPNRVNQGIKEVTATDKKDTPKLLKWVANDIISEEDDVLRANNLEWKQVAREVSVQVRQHFFSKLDAL